MELKIIVLALWFIVGVASLLQDKISKTSYALCWICLLFHILGGIIA